MGRQRTLLAAAGLAGAVVVVLCCSSAVVLSSPAVLLGSAHSPQNVLQQLDSGGFWSSLDDTVPLKSAGKEVDIGGRVVPTNQARRARRAVPGQLNGGQFLSDTVRDDPKHMGIYGGMYWGQETAPKARTRRAKGLVRRGDTWLRAPARGQRGAGDAQVGGIIKALEHQTSPPPPEWWVRKRQEWVHKQRIAAAKQAITKHLIKINPDFTGRPLESRREAHYRRGPALGGLRQVSLHKIPSKPHAKSAARPRSPAPHAVAHSASSILILPGKHLVHPHSAEAQDLGNEAQMAGSPRESTVEKALARAEAIRHKADMHLSNHDRAQALALEKTAASLRTLAEAMSGKNFQATPNKLASIAKQLSTVSESLAGSAEKQEAN